MPTQDEMDLAIADLEALVGKLRTLRAIQIMQQQQANTYRAREADVLPFPPRLHVETPEPEGAA